MPKYAPPERCPGTSATTTLAAGSTLVRVHSSSLAPTVFNPTASPSANSGGRFDSLTGDYAYLYAGQDRDAAIAETLLREVPFPATGARQLPLRELTNRCLSVIETSTDLLLVSLRGADLGQLGQDVWLTKCSAADYVETRRWASAIRGWVPDAMGFVWRSRRDEERLAYVLFEDRVPRGSLVVRDAPIPIDTGPGLVLVRKVLLRHNVVLAR